MPKQIFSVHCIKSYCFYYVQSSMLSSLPSNALVVITSSEDRNIISIVNSSYLFISVLL